MTALLFLIRKIIKNTLRQLLKKPVALIFYIAMFALIIFSATTMFSHETADAPGSPYMGAALLLTMYLVLYFAVRKALTQGTTVFSLEDVQLLFTSPIHPQTILLYGVVRQSTTSLTILFVLAMQFANLRNLFGMSISGYAMFLAAFFLMTLLSQIIALTLYALLAEKPKGKRIALYITNGSAVALLLAGGYALMRNPSLQGVADFFTQDAWSAFPLVGWLSKAVMLAQDGRILSSLLWIAFAVILGVLALIFLWRSNPDYYEDVLSLSQERFEMRQRMAAQGKSGAEGFSRRKVRLGKTGLSSGKGASAFFAKHMLEMRREGVLFIDQKTLLYVLAVGIGVFSMRDAVSDPRFITGIMLVMMVYIQMIFTMTTGRFTQEMLKPFLYLAPASSRSKVFFCNIQPAIKAALDALLCFVLAGILIGFDPLQCVLGAVLVGVVNLLFVGGTLLTEWILGESHSKMLGTFLYFLFEMLLLAPAVVLFALLSILSPGFTYLAYLACIAYCGIAALLLFLLLGSMLHNVETA